MLNRQILILIFSLLLNTTALAGSLVINQVSGFTDATIVSPVGGNPGTTIGVQRANVFAQAATIWTGIIQPNIDITIDAQFSSLACSPTSGVIGSAGPTSSHNNFTGATYINTWYPRALRDHLANNILNSTAAISANFNSQIEGNADCLNSARWYYGFDHNPGVNQFDLLGIVLHEMGHGLGFITFVNLSLGTKSSGLDDIYMKFLRDNSLNKSWPVMSNVERAASAKDNGDLVWAGSKVQHMMTTLIDGKTNNYPRLYAPAALATGSSVTHWDTNVTYIGNKNELIEYQYSSPFDMALTVALMRDLGWTGAVYDFDGDGVDDETDPFPANPSEWLDTDHDGIGNSVDTDDDGDGMPDVWEANNGLDPLLNDANGDADNDGDGNLFEYLAGINPQNPDTDGDNIPDGIDSNPLDNTALFDMAGIQASEHFGASVAMGDVNHDNYDDLIIGSPDYDTGSIKDGGRVLIISGKDNSILLNISGSKAGDHFGFAVASADVNNDNYADVIVSAPYSDVLLLGKLMSNVGTVIVYSGADLTGTALMQLSGDGANDLFGFAIAAGDVDNNGKADVIVGAPYDDDLTNKRTDSGSISVYSGANGSLLNQRYGSHTGDLFGSSLASGDVDNDNHDDIVVSAWNEDSKPASVIISNTGSVTVISGNDLAGDPLMKKFGGLANDYFGKALLAQDLNGDSHADIIVGSPQADYKIGSIREADPGSITIFDGNNVSGAPFFTFYGNHVGDKLGSCLAVMEDINSDSTLDVLVGESGFDVPTASTKKAIDTGQIVVLSGADGSLLATRNGVKAGDSYGSNATSGDINHDGLRDVVIGGNAIDATISGSIKKDAGGLGILSSNAFY